MLFVMMGDGVYAGPSFRMGVSASDTKSTWTVDVEDGQTPRAAVSAEPVHGGRGVVSVAGAAADVLLFLWGRRGADAVTLDGDDAASSALLRWLSE